MKKLNMKNIINLLNECTLFRYTVELKNVDNHHLYKLVIRDLNEKDYKLEVEEYGIMSHKITLLDTNYPDRIYKFIHRLCEELV